MSRFPPVPPSQQSREQATAHKAVEEYVHELYGPNTSFKLKNQDGAFTGPFAPILYSPGLVPAYLQVGRVTISNPLFTSREREIAILGCLSYSQAAYGLYAHIRLTVQAGFTKAQVVDAVEGKQPKDMSKREGIFYSLGLELAKTRGPLGDEYFDKAKSELGMESFSGVLHLIGAYLYSGLLFNAADVALPEGETLFPQSFEL